MKSHEQCYVLNLKKYKEYECPEIGEFKRNAEHFETVPIRSDENPSMMIHSWIKPILKWKNTNTNGMVEPLRTAFDNKEEVSVFDENIRHSKRCYYAAHETDYIENSIQYIKEIQFKCK